jgi:hypothetical protein
LRAVTYEGRQGQIAWTTSGAVPGIHCTPDARQSHNRYGRGLELELELGPEASWLVEDLARHVTAAIETPDADKRIGDAPEGVTMPHTEVSLRALLVGALCKGVPDLIILRHCLPQTIRVPRPSQLRRHAYERPANVALGSASATTGTTKGRMQRLRQAHAEAVAEIERERERSGQLSTGINGQVGSSILEAGILALGDITESAEPQQFVVAAPPGTGKTSHAIALMAAAVRSVDQDDPLKPYGCLFVVDQIKKADDMFLQISKLLPRQVAVWTSDHDPNCINHTQMYVPHNRRFQVDQLEQHAIAVVTQAFLRGPRGDKARYVIRNGRSVPRELTIFDEQTKEVEVYDIKQSQAIRVKEAIESDRRFQNITPKLKPLLDFLQAQSETTGNSIENPNDDHGAWKVARDLHWFAGEEAEQFVLSNGRDIEDLDQVFGFAAQMYRNYAFIFRRGGGTYGSNFMAYVPAPAPSGNSILLDATADIDRISNLVPWREHVEVPQVRYDNLHIIHADHYTGQNLSELLVKPSEARKYAASAKQLVLDIMPPGARGLIVCKKKRVIEQFPKEATKRDPDATNDDARFPWKLEGRHLALTWWGGYGIGANDWKTADYVFQFNENFLPKRALFAAVQGLRGDKATMGILSKTKSSNGTPEEVDLAHEGHLLRFMKQMGMRGRARSFDNDGICGKQVLVLTCDFERLLVHADRLFPGATLSKRGRTLQQFKKLTQPEKLMEILTDPDAPEVILGHDIAQRMGVTKWGDLSTNVMTASVKEKLVPNLGWTYETKRGPGGGSRFVRTGNGALRPQVYVPEGDFTTTITVKPH